MGVSFYPHNEGLHRSPCSCPRRPFCGPILHHALWLLLCYNPATTSSPSVANNPRVSIDLDGNTRTFRAVYPNNECTYQGDADLSGNGQTLSVTNIVCEDATACANNINFNCNTDFVVTSIGYSSDCADWEGTRNGAQLACDAQFNVPGNNNNDDSSMSTVVAPLLALLGA